MTTTWIATARALPIVHSWQPRCSWVLRTPRLPASRAVASFELRAEESYISQPDGNTVYSWGYGCASTAGITFAPAMPERQLPDDAGSGADADRHGGRRSSR